MSEKTCHLCGFGGDARYFANQSEAICRFCTTTPVITFFGVTASTRLVSVQAVDRPDRHIIDNNELVEGAIKKQAVAHNMICTLMRVGESRTFQLSIHRPF